MRKEKKLFGLLIIAFVMISLGIFGVENFIDFLVGGGSIMAAAGGAIVGPGAGVEGTLTTDDLLAQEGITDDDLNKLMVKVYLRIVS